MALERGAAGGHLVQHGPQRPDVAARVGLAPFQLLGRHVEHRAHQRPFACERIRYVGQRPRLGGRAGRHRLRRLRQPEIEQLDAGTRQHDVAGLEVTVDDAALVRLAERLADLGAPGAKLAKRHRAAAQSCREGLAKDELHDEESRALHRFLQPVERRDVRVVQRGQQPRFPLEPCQTLRVVTQIRRQNFDRHLTSEPCVLGLVHLAHAAGADLRDHPVVKQRLAGSNRHVRRLRASHHACAPCATTACQSGPLQLSTGEL